MELVDVIECRKISDDLWECSISIVKGEGYIKFNEGHFKTRPECLEACISFVAYRIRKGIEFKFICDK